MNDIAALFDSLGIVHGDGIYQDHNPWHLTVFGETVHDRWIVLWADQIHSCECGEMPRVRGGSPVTIARTEFGLVSEWVDNCGCGRPRLTRWEVIDTDAEWFIDETIVFAARTLTARIKTECDNAKEAVLYQLEQNVDAVGTFVD